ncbi:2-C-methyl-D-erythritol 4-phosphate cytidylyltransferase [Spiroplasma endosymbiont of Aspidapion aeneum]|uniref:2-C-methyl-D-erythritol 4-phosphate cytidylyltransferase n=1 Tax=Spiroplasma endosymbiont of Aspidapion aeneum TaxID=3066276 RepID=UPI00313CB3C0
MENSIGVIVVAAGMATRFTKNKLLVKLDNNLTVLETVIKKFLNFKCIHEIILVCSKENINLIHAERLKDKRLIFCLGGKTRGESVANGIKMSNTDFVLIHDAARPFFTDDLIIRLLKKTSSIWDIVVPHLKISDSLKMINNNTISTINRDNYFITQTPQLINVSVFRKIIDIQKMFDWQDELELYTKYYSSSKICLIEGEKDNLKLTFPKDLK